MKRRQFLTTAALVSIGASVAPQILKGQDPYAEYARMEQELTDWYVTPRGAEHVESNNFWSLLTSGIGPGEPSVDDSQYYHPAPDGLQGMMINPNLWRMKHAVRILDYNHVYMRQLSNDYFCWMNVEDFGFYERILEQGAFRGDMLGCGIVMGLTNPFCPINPYTSPVDGYEIHVMWRKR